MTVYSLKYIIVFFCFSVLTLKAERETIVSNLTGRLFNASDVFVNKNTCYCSSENCPPDGVRSVVSCKNAPAYISLPHFFNADTSYREAVDGMNPDPEMHSFFMVLEQVIFCLVSNDI